MSEYEIKDILKATGFNEHFFRRCLKEIKPVFDQHCTRGKNNRRLFDHTAYVIFDRIKQDREKGLSFSVIKEKLLNNYPKHNEQNTEVCRSDDQTTTNDIDTNPQEALEIKTDGNFKQVNELKDKLHQTEIEKIEAKHELDLIKSNLKLLPANGDPVKLRKAVALITKLEENTKAKFMKGKPVNQFWSELKEILFAE